MDLHSTRNHIFLNSLMSYLNMLKQMSLSLKKNSASKNMLIIVSILGVFILMNFMSLVIVVVSFTIGRWSNHNNKRQNE